MTSLSGRWLRGNQDGLRTFRSGSFAGVRRLSASSIGAAPREESGEGRFVHVGPRDGHYFEPADWRPFIPAGLNTVFPRGMVAEEEVLPSTDEQLKGMAEDGGIILPDFPHSTVMRTCGWRPALSVTIAARGLL